MKTVYKLIGIEKEHPITKTFDSDFLLLIQRAALLGLKDAGSLTEMQYRQADEKLLQQFREEIRAAFAGADGNA